MREADQNKAYVENAIERLTETTVFLENLGTDITEIGADLNQVIPHVDNALRKGLTSLQRLRDGKETASFVLRGTTGMVANSMQLLERADEDLQDLIKAINLIKQFTEDAQKGPYRTSSEERPRIVGKINAAIGHLRGYWSTL